MFLPGVPTGELKLTSTGADSCEVSFPRASASTTTDAVVVARKKKSVGFRKQAVDLSDKIKKRSPEQHQQQASSVVAAISAAALHDESKAEKLPVFFCLSPHSRSLRRVIVFCSQTLSKLFGDRAALALKGNFFFASNNSAREALIIRNV